MSAKKTVFIIRDSQVAGAFQSDCIENLPDEAEFLSLPSATDPAENTVFVRFSGKILEVTEVNDGQARCFFLGNSVEPDSAFFVLSPVDLRFLLLPVFLSERGTSYEQLDSLFERYSQSVPDISHVRAIVNEMDQAKLRSKLCTFCDESTTGGVLSYRVNQSKTIAWLADKTMALAFAFSQDKTLAPAGFCGPHGHPATRVDFQPKQPAFSSQSSVLVAYAAQVVSEYVPAGIFSLLLSQLLTESGQPMTNENIVELTAPARTATVVDTDEYVNRKRIADTKDDVVKKPKVTVTSGPMSRFLTKGTK